MLLNLIKKFKNQICYMYIIKFILNIIYPNYYFINEEYIKNKTKLFII